MDLRVHVDLAVEPEGRVNRPVGHEVVLEALGKASLGAGVAPLVAVVPVAATWTLALDWVSVEIR